MATTKVSGELVDLNESTSESGLKIPTGTNANRPATDVAGMVRNNTNETSDSSASCEEYYNGTAWQKLDQSNTVTSVNGQTGAVVLTTIANLAGGAANQIPYQTAADNTALEPRDAPEHRAPTTKKSPSSIISSAEEAAVD